MNFDDLWKNVAHPRINNDVWDVEASESLSRAFFASAECPSNVTQLVCHSPLALLRYNVVTCHSLIVPLDEYAGDMPDTTLFPLEMRQWREASDVEVSDLLLRWQSVMRSCQGKAWAVAWYMPFLRSRERNVFVARLGFLSLPDGKTVDMQLHTTK